MAIGQEPSTGYGLLSLQGKEMTTALVMFIPFHRLRYALFKNEDLVAYTL
jgi:hypothetical protein